MKVSSMVRANGSTAIAGSPTVDGAGKVKGARVLAVANQKGGVGKTTTAINLSAELARRGKRVLLVDVDPQGNATTGMGIEKSDVEHCMYDVIIKALALNDIVRQTSLENLCIAPSTLNLAGAEIELASAMSRELRLRNAIAPSLSAFDQILIDCPPSLGLLTLNAMSAADCIIVPIQAEYFALEGLGQLTHVIELVRTHLNPKIRILGVLITMFDGRTNLAAQVVEEVERYFPGLVFTTRVPRSVRLSEAPSHGTPIVLFDPKGKGATAYASLAEEVLARE
jgi:chromosome partitioning protein